MTTAILAVQGAFTEHAQVLGRLGEDVLLLRNASDLRSRFDRLVLPGGESTVQGKLLHEQGMLEKLRTLVLGGMPVLATCAGLVLLASHVDDEGARPIPRLGTLPVRARRNAYGRQLGSFSARGAFAGIGDVPFVFIRAPRIVATDNDVETLAEIDGEPVAARFGNQIACAFHPELSDDTCVHEMFLAL